MKIKFKPNKLGYTVIGIMLFIVGIIAFRNRKKIKKATMEAINFIKEKTWDVVSDRRINTLHPLVRSKAKELIIRAEKELGIKLRVVSALRTWTEQNKLYAKGRTVPGKKVTNAKGGSSYHNFGLAIDVVEIKNGKALWRNPNWNKIAELGKEIGFEWGGDWKSFKDKPHFQWTFKKSLAQLRQLYTSGKREGEYVNVA
jgi:peptidoglycan L-alanyl-D-glutamate endopeptidase CwlK